MHKKLQKAISACSSKPGGIYLFKVNKGHTKVICKMFEVNNKDANTFEHILLIVLVFPLLTLNK